MFRRHPVLSTLTLLYLLVVAWVTLGPEPYDEQSSGVLWQFLDFFARHDATDWITFSRVEFTANVLMFVPLGLFLVLLFGRRQWWLAVLLGSAISVAIELSQGAFLPTRVSDLGDVIANSSGALIGVVVGTIVMTVSDLRRRRRGRGRARVAEALG
jgi:glycopeptide antibiotics resistance protein